VQSKIKQNISLKPHNTFGMNVKAKRFLTINAAEELQTLIPTEKGPYFILGGGSNMLLTKDINALVLKNEIKEKKIIRNFKNSVYVAAGGGEDWHQFVLWCIKKGLGGIENLSLIPGTLGAAPIQNIGAYGVELKDVFHALEAINLKTGKLEKFKNKDCQFAYRESIFKRKLKGKYFITRVILKLSKSPRVNLSYGAIKNTLAEMKVSTPTIKDVSKAVIHIRSSKLPDPAKIGNSGSFFKNPELSARQFKKLQKSNPNIPHYPLPDGRVKVPAGWLIEQAGWKGKRIGDAGCHAKQALVLVNHKNAKGKDILKLSEKIQASVKKKFGVALSREVNVF